MYGLKGVFFFETLNPIKDCVSMFVCCTWYFPVKDASRLTLLDPCPAEEALVG